MQSDFQCSLNSAVLKMQGTCLMQHVSCQERVSFLAGPEASDDLEIGQTSELVALAQNPVRTYVPPDADNELHHSPEQNASQQRTQQLQALCAAIERDEGVSDSVRKVCAALQHTLSAKD